MAGSHHSARQPTRLSSIGRRSARSIGDRRRVSEADLRRAIYVRPLGLGYHVVKNVCNDQEYVVADATNSTFKAGVVVSLGSFTGNPGEFVLGKPPAGFGGASSFAIQRANAGYGVSTNPDLISGSVRNFSPYCCAYDPFAGGVLIPMDRTISDGESSSTYMDIVFFASGDLPLSFDSADEASVGEVAASIVSGGDYLPIGIFSTPGPHRLVLVYDASVSYGSGLAYRYIWFKPNGSAESIGDAWNGPDWFLDLGSPHMPFCIAGGSVYSLAPDDSPSGAGLSGYRIVKMSSASASELSSYSIPTVTPYQGISGSSQTPISITPVAGGGVVLWLRNDAASATFWRQPLDSSLSPVGSPTQVTGFSASTYTPSASSRRMIAQKSDGSFLVYGSKFGSGGGPDLFLCDGVSVVSDVAVDLSIGSSTLAAIAYRPDGQMIFYDPTTFPTLISYVDSLGVLHEA